MTGDYNDIKSFSFSESEILNNIITLHCGGLPFHLDCTYSKGNFYADGKVPQPFYKSDKSPIARPDVMRQRAESLKHGDKSLRSIMFDPPFLDGDSPGLKTKSKFQNRFGTVDKMSDLWQLYNLCLHEFYRVLQKGGVLVVKCQDVTSARVQHFSHCYLLNAANEAGFYAKDLFILLSRTRMRGAWKKQSHARKYHCYFWVFTKQKIKYVNHFSNL